MSKAFISSDGLEKLVENIKNSSGGGGSIPYTNHNGGIRGKNLGSTFTAEQKAAIADGSFNDIYVGDYWEIDGVKYVIVDIDYYMNYGSPVSTTDHHVIVLPNNVLSSQGYSYNTYYYGASSIYTTYLPQIATALETIFGTYLVNQNLVLYDNTGGPFWGSGKCILASMLQFQGYNQSIRPEKIQHNARQFSYFRYNVDLIASDQRNWLRDSNGDGNMSYAVPEGSMGMIGIAEPLYLRPYFVLAGVEQSQE
jgi:hypothetical protein